MREGRQGGEEGRWRELCLLVLRFWSCFVWSGLVWKRCGREHCCFTYIPCPSFCLPVPLSLVLSCLVLSCLIVSCLVLYITLLSSLSIVVKLVGVFVVFTPPTRDETRRDPSIHCRNLSRSTNRRKAEPPALLCTHSHCTAPYILFRVLS